MKKHLLMDPSYIEPPCTPGADAYAAYVRRLADLGNLLRRNVVDVVTMVTDVEKLQDMVLKERGTPDSCAARGAEFDLKDTDEVTKAVWLTSTPLELEAGIEDAGALKVSSEISRDTQLDALCLGSRLNGTRDRVLAAWKLAQKKRKLLDAACLLAPARGDLERTYRFQYLVRIVENGHKSTEHVKGEALIACPTRAALRNISYGALWLAADDPKARQSVVELVAEMTYGPAPRSLPEWCCLDSFLQSAGDVIGSGENDRAGSLVRGMAATLCGNTRQGGTRNLAWLTSLGGAQQAQGDYLAWHRGCGDSVWIQWWAEGSLEHPRRILFSQVYPKHIDHGRLPVFNDPWKAP